MDKHASKKRVMFVCASGGRGRLQLGGAERFLSEMLPVIAEEADVLAVVSDERIAGTLRDAGVSVTLAGPTNWFDLQYYRALLDASESFRPDVVSAHLLSSSVHARLAQMGRDKLAPRLIVTLHNSMWQYVSQARGKERLRAIMNLVVERIFRATVPHDSVAVSKFEAKELWRACSKGEVRLIYNSLPKSWAGHGQPSRSAARRKLGMEESSKILLYMGRLEIEKGADRLAGVVQRLPKEWSLLVAGDGVVDVASDRVVMAGHVSDTETYYRAADVIIVPSRVESFGRVALEAAVSARPVVHTNVGGLAEVLEGQDGCLSWPRPPDPVDLADGVVAAEAYARYHTVEVGEAAKALRDKFSFGKMARSWTEMVLR